MNTFTKYLGLFMIGGVFGFLLETVWCLIKNKKIESRKGLIYGHFIPIYAIACVLISLVVEIFNIKHFFLIFLVTFIISALDEYISSVFQEKCLGTSSWDYSKMKFNLNGRINLLYLLGFSAFGILWCKIYPSLLNFIERIIPNKTVMLILTILTVIGFILNVIISLIAGVRLKNRRKNIKAKNKFEEWIDKKYNNEFMKKIYPNSVFVN